MATVVKSMAVEGIEGFEVEVEVTVIKGQQQMISIIGLGDQAVREAGERIIATIETYGYDMPKDKVIISLAPGNRRKHGSHYDLSMLLALLVQTDQIICKDIGKKIRCQALMVGSFYMQTVKDTRFPKRSEMREFGKVYNMTERKIS